MSNAVVAFDRSKMVAALKQTARSADPQMLFLKMSKAGEWVYGAHEEEITEDMELLVNPGGFVHGFVCWADGAKLGEIVKGVDQPVEEPEDTPAGSTRGWEAQLGMTLKINDPEGANLLFNTSSVGGKRAVAEMAQQVAEKLASGDEKIVPVVKLSAESYKHKKYGTIYTPAITVVRWIKMPSADDVQSKAKAKAPAKAVAKRK